MKTRQSVVAITFVVSTGCAQGVAPGVGEEFPPPLTFGTGSVIENDGTWWCVRMPDEPLSGGEAIGPTAPTLGGFAQINEPSPDFGNPLGCVCVSDTIDTVFDTAAAMTGQAIITSAHGALLLEYRNEIYDAAEQRCFDLAANLSPIGETNCNDFIDRDEEDMSDPIVTPLQENLGSFSGPCPAGEVYGASTGYMDDIPDDNWSDYYTLGTVISWNHSLDVFEIDATFFQDVLDNPGWLLKDAARLEKNSGNDWVFSGVSAGTIAYALGLANGDAPFTLNGLDITTPGAALATYGVLLEETEFRLVVWRNNEEYTIEYLVIEP